MATGEHPSSKLGIRLISKSIVKAANSITPQSMLPVSNFDNLSGRYPVTIFYAYSKPSTGDFNSAVNTLKTSLADTLDYFFPFAGRIVPNPQTGEPEISVTVGSEHLQEVSQMQRTSNWCACRYFKMARTSLQNEVRTGMVSGGDPPTFKGGRSSAKDGGKGRSSAKDGGESFVDLSSVKPLGYLPITLCNNEGIKLIEASADVSIASLNFHDMNDSIKGVMLPFTTEIPLTVQVTGYACGGFSIAWSFDHLLADGNGFIKF